MCFNLIWLTQEHELMDSLVDELLGLLGLHGGAGGRAAPPQQKPVIGERFKFDQLKDALKTFQSGRTIGKVVVEV